MIKDRFVSKQDAIFTERELDVMDILWQDGSGTVSDVKERISDDLAYTTVLTILRTLEQKGFVGHQPEGRAYRYHPLVGKEEARESHLRRLTRKLFGGSRELLMAQLVSDGDLTREELERLRNMLDQRLG
ncbi:MAG: BlaI/MecI/CopY family transcriptional regulator [Gemmatimonadales bacterium]|nr:MAG: BlaI/MecI/CopY family transcriptional regulator [Gemmatimonadales bacterium]